MIRMEALRAGYNGVERVHGVDLTLPEGRFTALVGPNGCGKSTLIKCLSGIHRPDSGRLFLKDKDYASLPPKVLAQSVAYMPQSRLVPDISVRALATHGRYPHLRWERRLTRDDRALVDSALARTGMESFADRSVAALSGGERQMAYLAMMLAQDTRVLLLDEPTTYLDPDRRFRLMKLLRTLADEGRTVVTVLHDLDLALMYADELAVMRAGALVSVGAPETVCASGVLDDVFSITVEHIREGRYLFSPRN